MTEKGKIRLKLLACHSRDRLALMVMWGDIVARRWKLCAALNWVVAVVAIYIAWVSA